MTLQKEFEKDINKKARGIRDLKKQLQYLPEGLPDGLEADAHVHDFLSIYMPLDPPLNNAVRQQFIDAGFEVGEYKISPYGGVQSTSARKIVDDLHIRFDLTCSACQDGATCKIEKIHEEKVTEIKRTYEIVCNEGVEEEVFA